MSLKKSLSIVGLILLIYGSIFLYLQEEKLPLPKQLVIEHPFGQEYFLHQRGKKYCYGSMGNCGYIENITETGFDVVWEKSQKTSFEKKSPTVYAQTGSQRAPFLCHLEKIFPFKWAIMLYPLSKIKKEIVRMKTALISAAFFLKVKQNFKKKPMLNLI